MSALEGRDGIISVSLGHGFPWGDVADVGTKMLVVADGDRGKAERLARGLADEFFAMTSVRLLLSGRRTGAYFAAAVLPA